VRIERPQGEPPAVGLGEWAEQPGRHAAKPGESEETGEGDHARLGLAEPREVVAQEEPLPEQAAGPAVQLQATAAVGEEEMLAAGGYAQNDFAAGQRRERKAIVSVRRDAGIGVDREYEPGDLFAPEDFGLPRVACRVFTET